MVHFTILDYLVCVRFIHSVTFDYFNVPWDRILDLTYLVQLFLVCWTVIIEVNVVLQYLTTEHWTGSTHHTKNADHTFIGLLRALNIYSPMTCNISHPLGTPANQSQRQRSAGHILDQDVFLELWSNPNYNSCTVCTLCVIGFCCLQITFAWIQHKLDIGLKRWDSRKHSIMPN